MKWIDYREQLGLGFNDSEKFEMLCNILKNYVENVVGYSYDSNSYLNFCQKVGEPYSNGGYPHLLMGLRFLKCSTIPELLSYYIAFYNTYTSTVCGQPYHINHKNKHEIIEHLKVTLKNLNINFELYEDNDGVFIFPKGAKELDNALVSEPLAWLKGYPKTHKTYIIALKQYSEGIYIRDVADNLRKALECFLQEFLGNTKNLENNKTDICQYLGAKSVDAGVCSLFQTIINTYKNINDRIAKHNDAVDEKLLEFLLYQTGVLIRMILSIK